MELASGAMGTLLPKLAELLKEEYKLSKGAKRDLMLLRKEMESMEVVLRKVAEMPADQIHKATRIWANEVKEVSYVTEDSIDSFLMSMGNDPEPGSITGFLMKKTVALIMKDTPHNHIGNAIKDIKIQVRELADRRDRLNVLQAADNPVSTITVDPRLAALYADVSELVGVQEASEELIKRLPSDEGDSEQQLKILSILGFPGVGKTTLAKALYDRMRPRFDCAAFVSVGRNPEMKRVLRDILLEIDRKKYSGNRASALDERQCTGKIREVLKDKRYLIIVDDIWDTKSWEIIRWTLMDCKFGGIIIATTRMYDVATKTGDVYKLEPLSPDNSKVLLCMKLFGGKDRLPDEQTEIIIQKLLQKCGGVPLALITVASLFASRQKEDWYMLSDSINFGHADERTRSVILFSYYELPSHLRVCLLHLSIFPKNYIVRKDTLIWKWVAEGFIREESGMGLFEIGERYFNELINRSLIQPVEISHSGIIIGCYVHDMVADVISSLATEGNFVTILNDNEHEHASVGFKARRLALHGEVKGEQYKSQVLQIRSFNAFMCHATMMPLLVSFRVLRVLAIEGCSFQPEGNAYSLEHIGKLCHLRYLGLLKTPVRKLPEVSNLKFLEILDLRQTGIRELPKSVCLLSGLKCLLADGGSTRVSDWIGNLTSLEELSLSDVSSCPNFVKEVSKLTKLRELKIWIRVLDERSKKALVKSLGNLQKIQVLHLDGGLWTEDTEWEGYVPPRQLCRLSLRIKSLRLLRWINVSLLPNLSHLSVDVSLVEAVDLAILGNFPGLITLELFTPNNVSLDVKGHGAFPKLRHCYASGMLRFLEGAAPLLESVHFNVMLLELNGASFQCDSLRNLPLLMQVRVEILYLDVHGATEVEEAIRRTVRRHVNSPILHISKYKLSIGEEYAEKEEDNSELEEDNEGD